MSIFIYGVYLWCTQCGIHFVSAKQSTFVYRAHICLVRHKKFSIAGRRIEIRSYLDKSVFKAFIGDQEIKFEHVADQRKLKQGDVLIKTKKGWVTKSLKNKGDKIAGN